ncbi:MAG TPA: 16S rRNA (cytidine(1402)-2'-O)-methyltransferase [Acidimicrobiales bacterium]|jgi:16S rRNA (cytidine1402-2'-O)-methyltransferase|nr:16S rRNA (cytidine(1402)-2'-O)-methyltransferase [Acidimicrobiales bacterium]
MTSGVLVVVGTPIGNLADLSPRAVEALAGADSICCEDTRRTGRLLQHAGIDAPPLIVANEHTEAGAAARVVERLHRGERVAVVTDAGMPAISDPGERIVAAALAAGFAVEVVPGPSAVVAAVAISGLPTDRWVFEGFVPRKGRDRTDRLAEIAAERRTVVLYEAPHRLERTLADLAAVCGGDRKVAVARELTKLHEEVWRGSLGEATAWASAAQPRGELVVVLDGMAAVPPPDDATILAALRAELDRGSSTRDAAATVAAALGVSRRRTYQLALDLAPPESR